jgi:ubiquinone biosynthesis protein UbiJ
MHNLILTLAATTDPTETFRQWIVSWGQVAGAIAAITAVVVGGLRYAVIKPLDRKIAEATKQIQPGANGGQSLSDVNKKVDSLAKSVDNLGTRLDRIEERNLEIYGHILDLVAPRKRSKKAIEIEAENTDETE